MQGLRQWRHGRQQRPTKLHTVHSRSLCKKHNVLRGVPEGPVCRHVWPRGLPVVQAGHLRQRDRADRLLCVPRRPPPKQLRHTVVQGLPRWAVRKHNRQRRVHGLPRGAIFLGKAAAHHLRSLRQGLLSSKPRTVRVQSVRPRSRRRGSDRSVRECRGAVRMHQL